MAVYFSVLIYVQSKSFSTSRKIDLLSFILHIVKRVKKWYAIESQNIIKKNFGVKCVRIWERDLSLVSIQLENILFFTLAVIQTYVSTVLYVIYYILYQIIFFFWKYFKNLVLVVLQHSIIIILLFPISAITEAHTELLLYMTWQTRNPLITSNSGSRKSIDMLAKPWISCW